MVLPPFQVVPLLSEKVAAAVHHRLVKIFQVLPPFQVVLLLSGMAAVAAYHRPMKILSCGHRIVSSLARGLEMCGFRAVAPTAGGCGCSAVVLFMVR